MNYVKIQDELKEFLLNEGAADVGFCKIDDGDFGECRHGISIVVHLSDAIVDEIGAAKVAVGGLIGLFVLKSNKSGGRAKYICKTCHFAYRYCCHKKVNYPPSLIN